MMSNRCKKTMCIIHAVFLRYRQRNRL